MFIDLCIWDIFLQGQDFLTGILILLLLFTEQLNKSIFTITDDNIYISRPGIVPRTTLNHVLMIFRQLQYRVHVRERLLM